MSIETFSKKKKMYFRNSWQKKKEDTLDPKQTYTHIPGDVWLWLINNIEPRRMISLLGGYLVSFIFLF